MKKILIGFFLFGALVMLGAQSLPGKIIVTRDNVDYPPMEFHAGGVLTGFHVDLVNEVAAKLGIKVEWQEVPWARAMNMVETGSADGITYISQNTEREKWGIFNPNNVLSSATFCFIIRKDSKDTIKFDGNVESFLKDKNLLVIREFFLPDSVTKAKPKIVEAPNMKNLVGMLLGKRADVGIINRDDFLTAYKGTQAEKDLILLVPVVHEFKNFIAFSIAKKDEALSAKFAEALVAFKKTPRYAELKIKYGQ